METIISLFDIPYFTPLMLLYVWVAAVLVQGLSDTGSKFGTLCVRKRKAILIGIAIVFVIEYLLRTFM